MLLNHIHLPIRKNVCGSGCGGYVTKYGVWKMENCVVVQMRQKSAILSHIFPFVSHDVYADNVSNMHVPSSFVAVMGFCVASTKPSPQNHVTTYSFTEHWAQLERKKNSIKSRDSFVVVENEKFSFQNGSTKCCMIELRLRKQYRLEY